MTSVRTDGMLDAMCKGVWLRKALPDDHDTVVKMVDRNLTAIGHGFVNKMQLLTEINRGSVTVAVVDEKIVGVRVGDRTLLNLVVDEEYRGKGIGSRLLRHGREPQQIRVKCIPVGHISKSQREKFIDPRGFYERCGFFHWGWSKAKNFWQRGKTGEKAHFHSSAKEATIAVFKKDGETLFK